MKAKLSATYSKIEWTHSSLNQNTGISFSVSSSSSLSSHRCAGLSESVSIARIAGLQLQNVRMRNVAPLLEPRGRGTFTPKGVNFNSSEVFCSKMPLTMTMMMPHWRRLCRWRCWEVGGGMRQLPAASVDWLAMIPPRFMRVSSFVTGRRLRQEEWHGGLSEWEPTTTAGWCNRYYCIVGVISYSFSG